MKEKLKKISISSVFKILLFAIAGILFFENILFAYNNLQNRYPILGLRLNGQQLFLKNRSQLQELIQTEFNPGKPLRLDYRNQTFNIKPSDIGASPNTLMTENRLLEEGRKGNILERILTQNKALFGVEDLQISNNLSTALLAVKILDIEDGVNQDATPIMPNFMDGYNSTIPARDGVKVDVKKLSSLITRYILNPPNTFINIPVTKTTTHHSEVELLPIRQQLPSLVKNPISITSGGLTFTLSTEDILGLLAVKERPDPKNPKELMLVLRLDDKKLNQKLGDFAASVQAKTQAEFDEYDARIAIYSEFLAPETRSTMSIPTGSRLNVLGIQSNGPKIAYLTFDDGTNTIYHPMILDILKQYNVKATFFLIGQNVQRAPDIVKRTLAEGHVIGDHTFTHSFLPSLSPSDILSEIKGGQNALIPFNQNPVILFRPPFGGTNKIVAADAAQLGMKQILWDVDPRDWSEPPVRELVNRVVSHTFPGAIILLHSNHITTVRALPTIIQDLQAKGYSFQIIN